MNKEIQKMTHDEWLKKGELLFGEDRRKWKFVCPSCGNVQSLEDFEKINYDDSSSVVAFSCIGRWLPDSKGNLFNGEKPCNYTLGGLLNISELQVLDKNNKVHYLFKFYEEGK